MNFIQDGFIQAFALLLTGDAATYSAISTTLRASGLAMAASLLLGIPLGYLLGYFEKEEAKLNPYARLSIP